MASGSIGGSASGDGALRALSGSLHGGGAGGGVDLLPYAVIVVSPDGVTCVPVMNEKPFFEQLVDSIPKLLPYIMEMMKYFTAVPME